MYRHQCKHIQLSPQERAKEKRLAAKAGKEVAKGLSAVEAYNTPQEKRLKDKDLNNFLNALGDSL
jgi:hypothetical protein